MAAGTKIRSQSSEGLNHEREGAGGAGCWDAESGVTAGVVDMPFIYHILTRVKTWSGMYIQAE